MKIIASKYKSVVLSVVGVMFVLSNACATTYYVNAIGGNNGNTGTSPTQAWKTISKVNSYSFLPGDSILFKRDDVWRETLVISNSGTSAGRITFSAYGTGNKPAVLGSKQAGNWINEGNNIWYASFSTEPDGLFFIDSNLGVSWGERKTSKGGLSKIQDWWFDNPNNRLYILSNTDPNSKYTAVEGGLRKGIIANGNTDYITIEEIEVKYFGHSGAESWGIAPSTSSDHWIIQDNAVHHGGHREATEQGDGIKLRGGSNYLVRRNSVYEVGRHGIHGWSVSGSTLANVTVEHNIFYNNYHANIDFNMAANSSNHDHVIRHNYISEIDGMVDLDGNGGSGFHLKGRSSSAVLRNVDIYNNVGVDLSHNGINLNGYMDNIRVFNNSFYNIGHHSGDNGIRVASGRSPITAISILNNSCFMAGNTPNSQCVNTPGKQAGITVDHNIWYNPDGRIASINGTIYNNWNTYKNATGYDANGYNADPDYMDPVNSNLMLKPSSPAIDGGIDLSSWGIANDHDGAIRPQGTGFDIGAYEYLAAGPPTPVITANGSTSFCEGGSVGLDAGSGYTSYLWSDGSTTQTITITQSGTYNVTVTNTSGSGTSANTTVTVYPNPLPVITANGSTTLCPGDSVILNANSGYNTYMWTNYNDSCSGVNVSSVSAIGDDGNVPQNAIDGNLGSRWSNQGVGSWITLDMGEPKLICSVDIAWHSGDLRTSNFVISISNDTAKFTDVYTGISSGSTLNAENHSFAEGIGRYVRITVNGNSQNDWASVTEITINGKNGTNTQSITVGDARDYTVQVTDVNGCNGSSTIVLDSCITTSGTYNAFPASGVSVYPNPSASHVKVLLGSDKTEECILFLFDAFGRQVLELTELYSDFIELNLSNLPSGIYIVKIEFKDRQAVGKIIKK